jgi:hypothetical protein
MTLRTDTRLPPSWLAMLPQKFSAATTRNRPDGASPTEATELPHPASTPTTPTIADTVTHQDPRTTIPLTS